MKVKSNFKQQYFKKQAGFTLLETTTVLVIGSLAIGLVAVTFNSTHENNSTTDVLSELNDIRSLASSYFTSNVEYNGLSTGIVAQNKGLNSRWSPNDLTLSNSFKGGVVIAPYSPLSYSVSF